LHLFSYFLKTLNKQPEGSQKIDHSITNTRIPSKSLSFV